MSSHSVAQAPMGRLVCYHLHYPTHLAGIDAGTSIGECNEDCFVGRLGVEEIRHDGLAKCQMPTLMLLKSPTKLYNDGVSH